jgi:peptide/nickel transport system permease protein
LFLYLLKRLITGLITLFLYVSALFFVIQLVLPGDYVSQFALGLTNEESAEARAALGLDQPLIQRYWFWLSNLLHGNLGVSYSAFGVGPPVVQLIKEALPSTIFVFGIGTVLAFLVGFFLGKTSAWRGKGIITNSIMFGGIAFYTAFPPWLSFLMIYFVANRLGLPAYGLSQSLRIREPNVRLSDILWKEILALIFVITILVLMNEVMKRLIRKRIPIVLSICLVIIGWICCWYILGISQYSWEILRRSTIPIFTYTLLSFGEVMLIMRTSMMDTIHEDYIMSARAKGLTEAKVRDSHAARNAILPVISRLMTSIPFMLTGLVMIEQVLDWEGVGSMLFYAIGMQNVTLALGMLIIIGVLSLVIRLALDILQISLNPRIRYSSFS